MNPSNNIDDNLSPCNNQCQLDVDKTYCTSCYRTVEEKKTWWKFTREEKLKILSDLKISALKW